MSPLPPGARARTAAPTRLLAVLGITSALAACAADSPTAPDATPAAAVEASRTEATDPTAPPANAPLGAREAALVAVEDARTRLLPALAGHAATGALEAALSRLAAGMAADDAPAARRTVGDARRATVLLRSSGPRHLAADLDGVELALDAAVALVDAQ